MAADLDRADGPSNLQLWPDVAQVSSFYGSLSTEPTIAVVDSGVDASRAADFGARVVAQTNFVQPNTTNARGTDGFGHGTFVASIAAGQAAGYEGAAPGANIVSLDVLDDTGAGLKSDVLAAADWIYENRAKYDIRVANFSLLAGSDASFMYDPLDQAVEKLWLSGDRGRDGSRQLRLEWAGQRRSLCTRERPVRDHRRCGRHQRHGGDGRRLQRSLVGLRLHAGRLPASRSSARRAGT